MSNVEKEETADVSINVEEPSYDGIADEHCYAEPIAEKNGGISSQDAPHTESALRLVKSIFESPPSKRRCQSHPSNQAPSWHIPTATTGEPLVATPDLESSSGLDGSSQDALCTQGALYLLVEPIIENPPSKLQHQSNPSDQAPSWHTHMDNPESHSQDLQDDNNDRLNLGSVGDSVVFDGSEIAEEVWVTPEITLEEDVVPPDEKPAPSSPPSADPLQPVTHDVDESLDCESSFSSRTPPQCACDSSLPQHALQDQRIGENINYGSEEETDDEEEEFSMPLFPRTVLSTPVDPPSDCHHSTAAPARDSASSSETPSGSEFNEFQRRAFSDPQFQPDLRREPFSESNVGPTTPYAIPYDAFVAIWDRQFVDYIASETNRYAQEVAQQLFADSNLHPQSRSTRWVDTTGNELYVYFAVVLAMGVVIKTKIEEYWSAAPDIFYTPGFSAAMTLNRFQLLTKCLHFNNNRGMSQLNLSGPEAKLYKIKPVVDHLNMKFQDLYKLRQNITIDESLLQWDKSIPNKVSTCGIKTYELCESQTGYLWRFEVHANPREQPSRPSDPMDGVTPALVLRLVHGLENKGYMLWMDNHHNSPALARQLKTLGFDFDTSRTHQFVPESHSTLAEQNMRSGEATGCIQGQMLARCAVERKQGKVWYKKFFRRLLNISVLNAFIMHRHSSKDHDHRAFRMALVKSLIQKHTGRFFVHQGELQDRTNSTEYASHIHYSDAYPLLGGKDGRQRRTCAVCKKRVRMFCVGCQRPVCMGICFRTLHLPSSHTLT